jgi:cysteine desulfurase
MEMRKTRSRFPQMRHRSSSISIAAVRYFDHNATSPWCAPAKDAWLDTLARFPGNPASAHRLGTRAERALDEARAAVAELIRAPAADVTWTSGATEGNNAVMHHLSLTTEGEVWISALEHPCLLAAAERWLPSRRRLIPALASGVVDMNWIHERWATARPGAVAVMAANNETGVIQPWHELLTLCKEREVPLVCDAAQWIGKLPARGLGGCAFVTGCAHKFGGPQGVGFLKAPKGFRPLIVGGSQEHGRRAGTANVPGAVACAAALRHREECLAKAPPESRATVRDRFERQLAMAIPAITVAGRSSRRLWNTSAIIVPELDCRRRWVVRLDKLGFAVSTGSACASGREKPSHVLGAMGLFVGDRMVRVSGGWETPDEDWEALAGAFLSVAEEFGCRTGKVVMAA